MESELQHLPNNNNPSTPQQPPHDSLSPSSSISPSFTPSPKPTPVENLNLKRALFLLLVFNSGVIESFSFLYLDIFAGYATGTMIIVGVRIVNSHSGNSIAPALVSLGGFAIASFCAGQILKWTKKKPTLRQFRWLLAAELPFLVAAVIVSATVEVDNRPGHLSTIGLLAISMGFQVTAGSLLQVPLMGLPLATGTINTLFVDNPFKPANKEKTLAKIALLLALIFGSTAGTGFSEIRPWVSVLFSCVILISVQIALQVHLVFYTNKKNASNGTNKV